MDLVLVPNYDIHLEFVQNNTELGLKWMDPIVDFQRHDKLL